MDITRWSNTKIRLIILFAAKDGEKTRSGADCGSDHELLIAKLRFKLQKVGKKTRPFRYDLNQIPYNYTVEVKNRYPYPNTKKQPQWEGRRGTIIINWNSIPTGWYGNKLRTIIPKKFSHRCEGSEPRVGLLSLRIQHRDRNPQGIWPCRCQLQMGTYKSIANNWTTKAFAIHLYGDWTPCCYYSCWPPTTPEGSGWSEAVCAPGNLVGLVLDSWMFLGTDFMISILASPHI